MTGAAEEVHCDDLIDDPSQPEALRNFLRYARLPAVCKLPGVPERKLAEHRKWIEDALHPHIWTAPEPRLFASLAREVTVTVPAPDWLKDRPPRTITLAAGTRVRVTMASRFGDVGVTDRLDSGRGYLTRLPIGDLKDFSAQA